MGRGKQNRSCPSGLHLQEQDLLLTAHFALTLDKADDPVAKHSIYSGDVCRGVGRFSSDNSDVLHIITMDAVGSAEPSRLHHSFIETKDRYVWLGATGP